MAIQFRYPSDACHPAIGAVRSGRADQTLTTARGVLTIIKALDQATDD